MSETGFPDGRGFIFSFGTPKSVRISDSTAPATAQ